MNLTILTKMSILLGMQKTPLPTRSISGQNVYIAFTGYSPEKPEEDRSCFAFSAPAHQLETAFKLPSRKYCADNTNNSNYPKLTGCKKLPIFTVDIGCCQSYDLVNYSRTYEFEVVLLRNFAA